MNKLDLHDARKLLKAQQLIREVADYNYTSDSNPLFKRLYTLTKQIDKLFAMELEPKLQEEYNLLGETVLREDKE